MNFLQAVPGKPEEEATTEDALVEIAIIIICMSIFNQKIILCIACLKNVFFLQKLPVPEGAPAEGSYVDAAPADAAPAEAAK